LHVTARETTTGIEQEVEVKPTYGLSDEMVEQMLLDALDHGEEDLAQRRLAEARVEGERIRHATDQALANDADLLEPGEREVVEHALAQLVKALAGIAPSAITARIDELDHATHAWAGRRMNRAIAQAIEGKRVGEIERTVAKAKGVEAHLASEERARQERS
jgi:molecular chaperone HscA